MAPRIVLRPVFWTRSSLLVCVLAAGAHALALYSNVYLTAPFPGSFWCHFIDLWFP